MKRIILFSTPTEKNIKSILNLLFPKSLKNKIFAYMPSDGANCPAKYRNEWKRYTKEYGAKFRYIDNSKENATKEAEKLITANILIISGGNTFKLLDNLRKSGLDKAIKEFATKDEFILSGFSAGAIVLTPTIAVCNLPNYDENIVGIADLTGLNLLNFEVFPHYEENQHQQLFNKYQKTAKNRVKTITNEGYLVVNL